MLFSSMVFWNTLFVFWTTLLVASASASASSSAAETFVTVVPSSTVSGVVLPSSTAGLDPCMETCFEEAAAANSCDIDDVDCACASSQLQADLTQCLDAECSAFASLQATGLLSQLCNKVRVVATGSATAGHLTLTSASPTASVSPSASPQKSGAFIITASRASLYTAFVTAICVGFLVFSWL